MNMQMDVAPLSEKATTKLVLGNRPDCKNEMFLQGENTHPLSRQEPIVSALSFRRSTQAEQQCPRPAVDIPCSVHDSEDVKPQLVPGRWTWAGQAEECPGLGFYLTAPLSWAAPPLCLPSLGQDMRLGGPEV